MCATTVLKVSLTESTYLQCSTAFPITIKNGGVGGKKHQAHEPATSTKLKKVSEYKIIRLLEGKSANIKPSCTQVAMITLH